MTNIEIIKEYFENKNNLLNIGDTPSDEEKKILDLMIKEGLDESFIYTLYSNELLNEGKGSFLKKVAKGIGKHLKNVKDNFKMASNTGRRLLQNSRLKHGKKITVKNFNLKGKGAQPNKLIAGKEVQVTMDDAGKLSWTVFENGKGRSATKQEAEALNRWRNGVAGALKSTKAQHNGAVRNILEPALLLGTGAAAYAAGKNSADVSNVVSEPASQSQEQTPVSPQSQERMPVSPESEPTQFDVPAMQADTQKTVARRPSLTAETPQVSNLAQTVIQDKAPVAQLQQPSAGIAPKSTPNGPANAADYYYHLGKAGRADARADKGVLPRINNAIANRQADKAREAFRGNLNESLEVKAMQSLIERMENPNKRIAYLK